MKPLALTALVSEGPMARAYLGLLHAAGFRLERIVLMVQQRDLSHRRPVAPWLPLALRRRLARNVQDLRMNHWSREFRRRHAAWCTPWLAGLAASQGLAPSVFDSLTERADYRRYAVQLDEVFIDGLSDPVLARQLGRLPARSTVLFTGGGMVPAHLLNLPNCRFLHVHPGLLPEVRGADGLLWSMLLRGRPGATAFYMSPGLDTGDIILASDLALPRLPAQFGALDAAMRYRLLYAFVDPLLRAQLLLRLVAGAPADLFALPAVAQDLQLGHTFHFMNAQLRQHAYARMQATPAGAVAGIGGVV